MSKVKGEFMKKNNESCDESLEKTNFFSSVFGIKPIKKSK